MDLYEHKMIIKRWISSCETAEQVDLLKPFIDDFLIPKFAKVIESEKGTEDKNVLKHDLEETVQELIEEIAIRKLIISDQ